MPEHIEHKHNFLLLGIAVVLVALTALVFMFMAMNFDSEVRTTSGLIQSNIPASPPAGPEAAQGLGAEIYEQSSNPIEDKVPELAPAANPIEGAYTNPFE